jgi:60S ribosome subunit biogenesis protein NIP7
MAEIPLGFGTTAKSTQDCRKADTTTVVCYNDCDTGEYLRDEDTI